MRTEAVYTYFCDFCGEEFSYAEECKVHEARCPHQPKQKNCWNCGHLGSLAFANYYECNCMAVRAEHVCPNHRKNGCSCWKIKD